MHHNRVELVLLLVLFLLFLVLLLTFFVLLPSNSTKSGRS